MLLLVTILFGATAANAGIIIADRQGLTKDSEPCKEESGLSTLVGAVASFVKAGIIIADRGGIIIADRSGIIIADRSSQETCGIIIAD